MSEIEDKIATAFTADKTQYTAFMSMSEISDAMQSVAYSGICYRVWGGYENAERKMIGLSPQSEPNDFPIVIMTGETDRFGEVTHRDVLGAVMSSGIERKCVGDILVDPEKNLVYLFTIAHMADYIADQVTSIGRCSVRWKIATDISSLPEAGREKRKLSVSSLRIDCVIAGVYGLSRNTAQDLILRHLVFADHREIVKPTALLRPGSSVTVRGYGKFVFSGVDGMSRKGKTYIIAEVFK